MSRRRFLTFARPSIGPEEVRAVAAALRSGWLSTGPRVERFEAALGRYLGVPHAVALGSCTAALILALEAAGIGEGDEVLTTPFTFAATAGAILERRARPVLADIDPVTLNVDPEQLERRATPRTRAILPVHFAGRPCDMDAILAIARRRRLLVIQDAAHALEARFCGRSVAALGDAAAFSFHATKNLTTGEGGLLVARRRRRVERARILARHGLAAGTWARRAGRFLEPHRVVEAGFKMNMTDIQAALGLPQLRRLERSLARREAIWRRYDEAFRDLPVERPAPVAPGTRHARHLYTLCLRPRALRIDRDGFRRALARLGIGTGLHFVPLHVQPLYRRLLGHRASDFPNALRVSRRILSLPLSPALEDRDVEDVVEAVARVIARTKR